MSDVRPDLLASRLLARNVVWNIVGIGSPMIVGLIAIPFLIDGLGVPRFGVLTLAWMIVGYFSLFDLGLGRALTKLVAEKLGAGEFAEIPRLIWTAMALMLVLGLVGAGCVAALVSRLVNQWLNIPADLQSEALTSFYLLALGIPVIIVATGFRGVLEAYQRFGIVNAVRVPLGLVTFLGPLAVLLFSNDLVPVVVVLIVARALALIAYMGFCLRVEPDLYTSVKVQLTDVRKLVSFGGWMTISNIVGPMMVYLDRFLIGSVISMAAVAYYATPYEVVTKLWVLPGALVGVLFPAFSTSFAADRERAAYLFDRSLHYCLVLVFPFILVLVTMSREALDLWLGSDFANNSTLVLQLLSIGVFINSLARIPFAMVQSGGRPDFVAKAHLIELPFYLTAIWFVLPKFGISGVAFIWVIRIILDTIIFFLMARFLLPQIGEAVTRIARAMIFSLLILAGGFLLSSAAEKVVYVVVMSTVFAIVAWLKIFTASERSAIIGFGRRSRPGL